MRALILAGGKGTRLRPLTMYTPKPVVPVVNRPFLLYQIEILKRAGIRDIVLSLSYQPDKIEHILGDGSEFGVNLRYLTEPSPLGTAGAFRFAAPLLDGTTVVLNGDIVTDLDIRKVVDHHRENNAAATITLAEVPDVSKFGVCELSDAGRVRRFIEKPQSEALSALTSGKINAGIYVLEPEILELVREGASASFEYDVFPAIIEREMAFHGYEMSGYWLDIGTPENYLQAHDDFLAGRVTGFEFDRSGSFESATRTEIDAASVIGDDCVIKPGARISNSVIGRGVHVEEKAVIENSVIWAHTRISAGAEITGAVIGRSCHIGRSVRVGRCTVLGDKTTLTDYTRV
jgi:NDP-sugar pyrophosphorylase family protein